MLKHRLSSRVDLSTLWASTLGHIMRLFEMSVESLDEGSPLVTVTALPGLVVLVVAMHVINQSSEPATLPAADLADAEPLIVF